MSGDKHRALLDRLREMAVRVADATGVELVELNVRGSSRKRLVRLDIDRAGAEGVNLEDCRRVSRTLEQELEAVDLIDGSYTLEVSSPGIDRPIVTDDDLRRNTGRFVRVDFRIEDGSTATVRGVLDAADASALRVRTDESTVEIPRHRVESACQDVNY